jgi:hypothetical protein
MIIEDYVSFETAKRLKEKGFDWMESPFYYEQDRDEWRQQNSYTIPNPDYNPDIPFDWETQTMVAPHISLQMAMKWLREKKHIFIRIIQSHIEYCACEIYYNSALCYQFKISFDSYEQACEAAIKYCLENLI